MRAVLPLLAMGVWGVACATASADGSHGQVGLRLGIGAPIDNNMRDWKDVGVIHGISWFLNHKAGTSLMSAVDIDSRIPAKASSDGRAAGITYTLRQVTANDGRYRSYIGGGIGLFRTEVSAVSGGTSAHVLLGGKAIIGRMDTHGHFVEAAYTYTGSSVSNDLAASVGIRF